MFRNHHHAEVSPTTVVNRRMGLGASLVWGLTGIIVTAIVAGSGLAVYALRVVDRRADGAVDLVSQVLGELPEYRAALPPALADAIDDVRRPDYRNQLAVTTKLLPREGRDLQSASVEVRNSGEELVSLLSMRIVGMDSDGQAIEERTTYAATPIQIDNDWRGPLLPGETRRFVVRWWAHGKVSDVTHEITDLRVWKGPHEGAADDEADDADKGSTAYKSYRSQMPKKSATREVVNRRDNDD